MPQKILPLLLVMCFSVLIKASPSWKGSSLNQKQEQYDFLGGIDDNAYIYGDENVPYSDEYDGFLQGNRPGAENPRWSDGTQTLAGSKTDQTNYGHQNQQGHGLGEGIEPVGQDDQVTNIGQGLVPTYGQGSSEEDDKSYLESLFDRFQGWGETVLEKVDSSARHLEQGLHETVSAAKETASEAQEFFHDLTVALKEKIEAKFESIKQRFKIAFSKFGVLVQKGAAYTCEKIQHLADKIESLNLIEKLEKKLEEGDEKVAALFQLIGEKITKWLDDRRAHDQRVDEGLLLDHDQIEQEMREHFHQTGFPDLFQDEEVRQRLTELMNQGVLQKEDIDALSQRIPQATFQVDRLQHPSGGSIHGEGHQQLPQQTERANFRKLRSWVDGLKAEIVTPR